MKFLQKLKATHISTYLVLNHPKQADEAVILNTKKSACTAAAVRNSRRSSSLPRLLVVPQRNSAIAPSGRPDDERSSWRRQNDWRQQQFTSKRAEQWRVKKAIFPAARVTQCGTAAVSRIVISPAVNQQQVQHLQSSQEGVQAGGHRRDGESTGHGLQQSCIEAVFELGTYQAHGP